MRHFNWRLGNLKIQTRELEGRRITPATMEQPKVLNINWLYNKLQLDANQTRRPKPSAEDIFNRVLWRPESTFGN